MTNNLEYVKFGNLFEYENKSKIKAGEGLQNGEYPFYTSSANLTKFLNDFQFNQKSIIFGTGGNASVHYCELPFSVSTDCLVAIPKDNKRIDVRYVYFYLLGNLNILEEGFKGAGLKHISKSYINEISIPMPSFKIQKQISEIMAAANTLKSKGQDLLKKNNDLTQAIFNEIFGDPIKNLKQWDIIRLGNCCDVGSSVRVFVDELVDKGIPFLRGQEIGAMSCGEKIEPTLFISEEHYYRLKSQGGTPKIGDLLMPSICPDGRIYQVLDERPFYFKDGRVLWIKVNENYFDSTFLKFLLKEKFLRNYSNIASGTTFAELKIFALKDLELIIPPIDLQKQFAKFIINANEQLQNIRKTNQATNVLFESIIQKAFSGQLLA